MVDEIHLFDSSFDPLLLSEDILEIQLFFLRTEDGDILQNQFLFTFPHEIRIGLTHFFLLFKPIQPPFSKEDKGEIEFQVMRISRIRFTS